MFQNILNKILKLQDTTFVKKFKDKIILILSGIAIGIANGFFGGGGGMICVPLLEKVLKIDNKKSHSTALAVMLPIAIFSIIVYLIHVPLDWEMFGFVGGGFVLGGLIGALLLNKLNGKIVRIIFIAVVLAAGIRLLI
ncbi:MAG: TSUP family transporter [Christensenellales bacterium]